MRPFGFLSSVAKPDPFVRPAGSTHRVFNQSFPLENVNLAKDEALQVGLIKDQAHRENVLKFGEEVGSKRAIQEAADCNR